MAWWRPLAGALALAVGALPAFAGEHGLSAFGDLKYPPGFAHFDYVNPEAPKGGTLRLHGIDSFDSLNPFILKGVPAAGAGLAFETLMVRADDEPDAVYGLIARSAEVPADRSWVAFEIDPRARWWNGTPITAADVAFSFETLRTKGHPRYRVLYRDVVGVRVEGPLRVRFEFTPGVYHRDLPLVLAAMPVLSKAYWSGRDFAATTLEPPLSSGPYRMTAIKPGRSVTYARVADYWGRELAVNRGRWNFDRIRVDYYRDRGIALEAFFAGEYDFREEFTSKSWATGYDKPPVRAGLIKREVLPDHTPSGVQAFFINTRRAKFADRRVRRALNLAFDFEWINKNLFYGLYERTTSMFENSTLAAKGPPSAAELALLEPFRGRVPDEVFTTPYAPPRTDGSGNNRRNLRRALALLREAGWRFVDGRLEDERGKPFEIEFLMFEPTMQRIVAPFARNLARIGIDARMRTVDVANYQNRVNAFDFDIIMRRIVMPLTPGLEQRSYWSSAFADTPGGPNVAGIRDPVVDALVEKVIDARSRQALVTAARALDRVLMWGEYVIPNWYKGEHHIAYWDRYRRPARKPEYARGVLDTWWWDADKSRRIDAGLENRD